MMEAYISAHHEGSISPSLPHIFTSIKSEPADFWNPPTSSPSNNGLSENYSTYTPLETLPPESPYAQFVTVSNGLASYSAFPPYFSTYSNISDESDAPGLNSNFFRNAEGLIRRDEGFGSSPSSINSESPPVAVNDHLAPVSTASSDHHYFEAQNERSSPGDSAFSEEFPLPRITNIHPQCVRCGSVSSKEIWWGDRTGNFLCANCYHDRSSPLVLPHHENNYELNDRKRKRPSTVNKKDNQICTNCEATSTSLWRRNMATEVVCNACGLYEKLHKCARPISMKKDTIQTRKRKPRGSGSRKKNSDAITAPGVPKEHPATSTHSYTLPAYSSLTQLTQHIGDSESNLPSTHDSVILPPISSAASFYANYRPEVNSPYHLMQPSVINIPLDPPRVPSASPTHT